MDRPCRRRRDLIWPRTGPASGVYFQSSVRHIKRIVKSKSIAGGGGINVGVNSGSAKDTYYRHRG